MSDKYNKYIWLFGENLGESADNNSFYLWKHVVNKHDEVEAYFIACRTSQVLKVFKRLSNHEQKYIVWRNSIDHIRLYNRADMLFVSVSYRDVQPDKILFKSYKPLPTAPLVYLQHGTLAMKKIDYSSTYANNSMIRFMIYNPNIREKLIDNNGFKEYQIYDGISHPRYAELARRTLIYRKKNRSDEGKKILWFITWREYLEDNDKIHSFIDNILSVLNNPKLKEYVERERNEMTICLHRYFSKRDAEKIKNSLNGYTHVRFVYAKKVNIMNLLVESNVLITDYSSVGFDFTFLAKPVILYQPDLNEYTKYRELYCDISELKKTVIGTAGELVDSIIQQNYGINPFFRRNMHYNLDLYEVANDKYNERLFSYFYSLEKNSISFFGYDFSGIGGTAFATKALAEGLMEKGYLVRAFTLKQVYPFESPSGLAVTPATRQYHRRLSDRLVERVFFLKKHYSHLKQDPSLKAIRPLAGLMMTYWMKHIHSSIIVSTRESLHLFLREATSPFIVQKIYFFHTSSNCVESLFPDVLSTLQHEGVEKAAFVTKSTMDALAQTNGFTNYKEYGIIGNCLDSSRCLSYDEVGIVMPDNSGQGLYGKFGDNKVHCAYMLRISKDRKKDIDNLICFADYLKQTNSQDIVIDLYGKGDYVGECLSMIDEHGLKAVIDYHGVTQDIKQTLFQADLLVDFSNEQSFGMPYIEGVLNGKVVLCKHNEGSDEVLRDIPEFFYSSNEELAEKIRNSKHVSVTKLRENYRLISKKYSRDVVADRFLDLINRKAN